MAGSAILNLRNSLPLDRTVVIVPAFNEAGVVRAVLQEIRAVFPHVVGVDDGSSDGTRAEIRAAGAVPLRHPINVGQGGALETGIRYGLRQGSEYFVTMDADGQHRVGDALEMLSALVDSGDDIILGSRFLPKAGETERPSIPAAKRWLLRLATFVSRSLHGLKLTDTHNGLRVFNARSAAQMSFQHCDMAHASEIYEIIRRQRLRYREHAVRIRYTEYSKSKGQSGLNAVNILVDFVLNQITGRKG